MNLTGGSAAKVLEPCPQKNKPETAGGGEFFALTGGLNFQEFWNVGSPFLWLLIFWRETESN